MSGNSEYLRVIKKVLIDFADRVRTDLVLALEEKSGDQQKLYDDDEYFFVKWWI